MVKRVEFLWRVIRLSLVIIFYEMQMLTGDHSWIVTTSPVWAHYIAFIVARRVMLNANR